MKPKMYLLFLLIAIISSPVFSAFTHPGILHTKSDLDFVKAKIKAEEQPWEIP